MRQGTRAGAGMNESGGGGISAGMLKGCSCPDRLQTCRKGPKKGDF